MAARALAAGVLAGLLLGTAPAWAVIEKLTRLDELIQDCGWIAVAQIDKLSEDRPAAVVTITKTLKGTAEFERRTVGLKGESDVQSAQLRERVAVGTPLLVFVRRDDDGTELILAYTNGTWLQLQGRGKGENRRWVFTHFEPYLRRTYHGSTAALSNLLGEVLSGKAAAPAPAETEKPGLGPVLEPQPASK